MLSLYRATDRLSITSTFWDACNAVNSLPKNNLLAALNVIEGESALASDALEELNTVSLSSQMYCC